jgi:HD-GYP domain-containing protein (c-di-GMP phosphodiesterase class II)
MTYVPIPVAMLEVGRPLPVDIWSATGQLLLKKGQPIVSEQHRDKLHAFNASSTAADAMAWQRAYERMVHEMLRDGVDVQTIAKAPMPARIREVDYAVGTPLSGGWPDLQDVLRGILYQGGLAINPLPRLDGIARTVLKLLEADADDALFRLFQLLPDNSLGYCATHALLTGVICVLTAEKLGFDDRLRRSLLDAALTQNIGMARDQDSLSRQQAAPSEWQRRLITDHPVLSAQALAGMGLEDEDTLDLVRWHHQPLHPEALPRNRMARRVLATADAFVAKMAARKSRTPLPAISAAKSIFAAAEGEAAAVSGAMATSTGFYPPGTYVLLVNGDTAVVAQRGARANAPWVIPVMDKNSMPVTPYTCRDTREPAWAMVTPLSFQSVRIAVQAERVQRARVRLQKMD